MYIPASTSDPSPAAAGTITRPTITDLKDDEGPEEEEDLLPNETLIRIDTKGLAIRIPLCILFVVLGVWCFVFVGTWKARAAGIASILCFTYVLVVLLRLVCCERDRPAVILNCRGITTWDLTTNMQDFVPWDDIASLAVVSRDRRSRHGGPYLLLNLAHDPTACYLARGNPLQRACRRWVFNEYGTPFLLWAQGKEIEDFGKLCLITNQYYQRYGRKRSREPIAEDSHRSLLPGTIEEPNNNADEGSSHIV